MRVLTIFIVSFCLQSSLLAAGANTDNYERNILDSIKNVQQLEYEQALESTRQLIQQYPKSRLAHLLYADLLLARTGPLTQIGSGIPDDRALQDFTYEIRQRWQHDSDKSHENLLPGNILFLADSQPYVILVDQEKSRVYVYRNENGSLMLETDYFITIGLKGSGKQIRGDQKTPVGVYHTTQYIDGSELPDLYGEGAFPINYPNAWDRRKQRTGDGIWIHGTPSYTYNRAPLESNGCIVVSNPDFTHIAQFISPDINTPVVVTERVSWLTRKQWQQRRSELLLALSRWIDDWESLNHERYRQNYSQTDYQAHGRNFKNWDRYKRQLNSAKTRIKVEYSDLNIFNYPGEQNLVLMQFRQEYQSNNLDLESNKELYWYKAEDKWQIVYEGSRSLPSPTKALAQIQPVADP
ncbi:MAG: murein L,D-transpeptidase family protein [Gammaproteobacteria bacterium]